MKIVKVLKKNSDRNLRAKGVPLLGDLDFERILKEEGNLEKNVLYVDSMILFWENNEIIGFTSGKTLDEDKYYINATMLVPEAQGKKTVRSGISFIPNYLLARLAMMNFWSRNGWSSRKKLISKLRKNGKGKLGWCRICFRKCSGRIP